MWHPVLIFHPCHNSLKTLDLSRDLEVKLNITMTIIELELGSSNYNLLRNKIDTFEPEERSLSRPIRKS
jgi:hypothetical protein